jgi:hypothetical protein
LSKSDKELAVDVAIAYIQANGLKKHPNGGSLEPIPLKNVLSVIEGVYSTLTKLPDKA